MDAFHKLVRKYGPLAARLLLAQLFILSGCGKIGAFANTAAHMADMGLPLSRLLLILTIALEVGGGALLALGWRARWIATALFGFTFLATLVFHAFWNAEGTFFGSQLNNFMKNLAIMGGMLYVMAYGAGPFSLGRDSVEADAPPTDIRGKKRGPKK